MRSAVQACMGPYVLFHIAIKIFTIKHALDMQHSMLNRVENIQGFPALEAAALVKEGRMKFNALARTDLALAREKK